MTYSIVILPLATHELQTSFEWYHERSAELAIRFLDTIERKLNRIATSPFANAKRKKNYREAIVHGFPFVIIYEISESQNAILISHIFHTKRGPLKKYSRK